MMALAQGEQPSDAVDAGAGQDDARDRRRAKLAAGPQYIPCSDLRVDVRRGIQDEPRFAVARDGDRSLGPRLCRGITPTPPPAGRRVRVPLWKAAASGGAQDYDTHGRLPRDRASGR